MDSHLKQMNIALLRYFHAEKRSAALLGSVGLAALGLAAGLSFGAGPLRAARWPLGAIGLVQGFVGILVYLRTDPRIRRLLGTLNTDPTAFRAVELPRMDRVQGGLRILRWIETTLLAMGLALIAGASQGAAELRGIGWGLMVQAVVSLAFDTFAEGRGAAYRDAIRRNIAE